MTVCSLRLYSAVFPRYLPLAAPTGQLQRGFFALFASCGTDGISPDSLTFIYSSMTLNWCASAQHPDCPKYNLPRACDRSIDFTF